MGKYKVNRSRGNGGSTQTSSVSTQTSSVSTQTSSVSTQTVNLNWQVYDDGDEATAANLLEPTGEEITGVRLKSGEKVSTLEAVVSSDGKGRLKTTTEGGLTITDGTNSRTLYLDANGNLKVDGNIVAQGDVQAYAVDNSSIPNFETTLQNAVDNAVASGTAQLNSVTNSGKTQINSAASSGVSSVNSSVSSGQTQITNAKNDALSSISTSASSALEDISDGRSSAVDDISSEADDALYYINEAKIDALSNISTWNPSEYLKKSGGQMTGFLKLSAGYPIIYTGFKTSYVNYTQEASLSGAALIFGRDYNLGSYATSGFYHGPDGNGLTLGTSCQSNVNIVSHWSVAFGSRCPGYQGAHLGIDCRTGDLHSSGYLQADGALKGGSLVVSGGASANSFSATGAVVAQGAVSGAALCTYATTGGIPDASVTSSYIQLGTRTSASMAKDGVHINKSGVIDLSSSSTGASIQWHYNNGSSYVRLYASASNRLTCSGTISQSSDRRLKTAVTPLADRGNVQPVTFIRIDDPEATPQIGFIAQEVEKVYPELVDTDIESGLKSVNYSAYTAVLQAQVIHLQERLKAIEETTTARIEALELMVQQLLNAKADD